MWQPQGGVLHEVNVDHHIAFSGDGRLVAALGAIPERDRIHLWDVGTGQPLQASIVLPDGYVFDFALSRDGSTVVAVLGEYGFGGQTAHVWNTVTGAEIAVLPAGGPIALAPEGRFLASARGADPRSSENHAAGEADRWLRLWRLEQSAEPLPLFELDGTAKQLAFSPDGAWLAVTEVDATGGQLYLVDLEELEDWRLDNERLH